MFRMFENAASFNQNIGNWNTAAVFHMSYMFAGASAFNQNIGNWNTGAVTFMSHMFNSATAFNQDISGWDVGSVSSTGYMFAGATAFQADITGWTQASGSSTNMFQGSTAWLARYKRTANDGRGADDGPASAWVGPGPFADSSALLIAVDNCLNSVSSGACDCQLVDCGAAEISFVSWSTRFANINTAKGAKTRMKINEIKMTAHNLLNPTL